jgi:membrane protease YdiL (CAAX protease family)
MNENKNSNPNFDFYSFNLPQTEKSQQPETINDAVENSTKINEPIETAVAEEAADAPQETAQEAPAAEGEALTAPAPYDYEPERRRMRSTYSHLGWGVAIITIAWIAISSVLYVVMKLFSPELVENGIISTLLGTLPLYVICMPLLFLIIFSRPRAVIEKKKLKFGHFMLLFFMAQALMMAGSMIGNNIMEILSTITGIDFYNKLNDTMDLPLWFSALLTVVLAPIFEELIFRKLLLDRMLPHGEFAAIFVNGLLFGAFHGNFYQFFYAALLGMLLSFVYARTGKIHHCIFIHMAVNFFGGVLPTIFMNWADYDTLMTLVNEMINNPEGVEQLDAITQHVMNHLGGTLCVLLFVFVQYALAALGVVFFIIRRRKFALKKKDEQLSGRMALRAAIVNPGVIAALVVCGYLFVNTLLSAVIA